MPDNEQTSSSYLKYLPAIFNVNEDPFLGSFLLAFEQVLTGRTDVKDSDPKPRKGLEEISASIAQLFNPFDTAAIFKDIDKLLDAPEAGSSLEKEFLQWLASWTALSLRADLKPDEQREFIAKIVPLYKFRGTKSNLEELLAIYTKLTPTIEEPKDTPLQIGKHSTIGVDTQIGGNATPHLFRVNITIAPPPDEKSLQRQRSIIKALIDLQKPAHTDYELKFFSAPIQIGVRSTVGRDTFLGVLEANKNQLLDNEIR
jgi:phage tail-like protein